MDLVITESTVCLQFVLLLRIYYITTTPILLHPQSSLYSLTQYSLHYDLHHVTTTSHASYYVLQTSSLRQAFLLLPTSAAWVILHESSDQNRKDELDWDRPLRAIKKGFRLRPGRRNLHPALKLSSSDQEVQEEDQEVQEDVLEAQEDDPEADHVVADHDQDQKVAEHAVLQATAHAKS